ncbi:MAG: ComEC/Rec2 family competence protein, partial [Muribaculaceae bacterium]|nr:ComEC/Rec2 family competence protein [Muribaculaceae bacterium]
MITGLSPSIVRACIMVTAFILALILERKNTALNSLSLAGFIILLFDPQAIYDISFQLSFLCVASLILFAAKLNPIKLRHHPKLHHLAGMIIATLIATFSSWVVVAYYFNNFPSMFLPCNIIVLPLLPYFISYSLILFFLEGIGLHSDILCTIADNVYDAMLRFIEFISNGSAISIHAPGITIVIWMAGLLLLVFYFYNRHCSRPLFITLSVLCFLGSIFIMVLNPVKSENGIIVCNTYPNLELKIKSGENEQTYKPPVNAISYNDIDHKTFLIVDYK